MSEQKPQDPFEMFRRLWGPLGVPLPGMAMPTLDPQELDKRIADLRSIEAWLRSTRRSSTSASPTCARSRPGST